MSRMRDDISGSIKTGQTNAADSSSAIQHRFESRKESRGEVTEKTDIEENPDIKPMPKTLRLGKKTKVCIFSMILGGILIIIVPIIIAFSVDAANSSPDEDQSEASFLTDLSIGDRIGLVNKASLQKCQL